MTQKAFFLDENEVVVEIRTKITGVPYADYFVLNGAYFIRKIGEGVEIAQALNVKWVKSTYLEGILEKKFRTTNEKIFLVKMKPIFLKACQEWYEERKRIAV